MTTLPELLSASKGSTRGIPFSELARPAAAEYLRTITSLSLAALQSEPARIKEECTAIESELTNLCFREHRTFIEVHRCADDVQDALEGFGDSLDRLLEAVPPLEKECEAFAVSARGIQQARRRATLVLEHQDKLLDLLEIPQLMDTCVRNGYYQEAMELFAHANKLAKRYADVPIVLSVQAEVASVMQLQFAQLLAVLREPVKLPTLVKAVGFLRRMGRLPEDELRIAFLESRDFHFQTQLTSLERDRSDKVRYTRRYVDLFRENIYDVISHYGSIFLDPALFVDAVESASGEAMNILVIFCHRAVDDLMTVIDQTFPHIPDTSSLSSLLTQLGYCSLSFARVGLDFSNRLVKPFEKAVLDLTVKGFNEAAQSLITTIEDASRLARTPSTWMCASEHVAAITNSETSPPVFPPLGETVSAPPSFLTAYPPLAVYLNGALSTLNSLRLLAPQSLQEPILRALDESLAQISDEIIAYARPTLHQTANAPTRPSGLRRNNSIGNHGISVEVRSERNTAAKRILCAFASAFLVGVVPHLRRALVVGVYAGDVAQLSLPSSATRYKEAISDLEAWIDEHRSSIEPEEATPADMDGTTQRQVSQEVSPQVTAEDDIPPELPDPSSEAAESSGRNRSPSPVIGRSSIDLSSSQVSDAVGYDADVSATADPSSQASGVGLPAPAHDPALSGSAETDLSTVSEDPIEPEAVAVQVGIASDDDLPMPSTAATDPFATGEDKDAPASGSGADLENDRLQNVDPPTQPVAAEAPAASPIQGTVAMDVPIPESVPQSDSPADPPSTTTLSDPQADLPAGPSSGNADAAAVLETAVLPPQPSVTAPPSDDSQQAELELVAAQSYTIDEITRAAPTESGVQETPAEAIDVPAESPDPAAPVEVADLPVTSETSLPEQGESPTFQLKGLDTALAAEEESVEEAIKPEISTVDDDVRPLDNKAAQPVEAERQAASEADIDPAPSGAQTPADEDDEANGVSGPATDVPAGDAAAAVPAKTSGSKGKKKKKKKK